MERRGKDAFARRVERRDGLAEPTLPGAVAEALSELFSRRVDRNRYLIARVRLQHALRLDGREIHGPPEHLAIIRVARLVHLARDDPPSALDLTRTAGMRSFRRHFTNGVLVGGDDPGEHLRLEIRRDRQSTRLNSSH